MKPLLPRVNSYLVPIQFPVSQPLVLQSSVKVPLSVAQGASLNSSETGRSSKRVRIAPKVGVWLALVSRWAQLFLLPASCAICSLHPFPAVKPQCLGSREDWYWPALGCLLPGWLLAALS